MSYAHVNPETAGGRLTLTSGTAVTTADVTGATSVYYTPYKSSRIAIYDGSSWQMINFAETTLALGTLTSGLPYDVFANVTSGALGLELLAWTNGATRATALVRQDGVWCKTGSLTKRYLGTFYTTSTTTTADSVANRYLWNVDNRVTRQMSVTDAAGSWNYTTATWRQANANINNRLLFITGLDEDPVTAFVFSIVANSGGAGVGLAVGVGNNSTSVNSSTAFGGATQSTAALSFYASYAGHCAAGLNFLTWLEYSTASGTTTWYGSLNATTQSGMIGTVLA